MSKPVANSIWGTVHEPKSPIADEDEAAVVEEAAAAVVDTAATFEAAAVAVLPVPATGLPWSSTSVTAAKSVVIPNTALKASAWAPVFAVCPSAAVDAVAQVSLAVWSAPHVLVRVSQMNCVMISMPCAEPWLYEAAKICQTRTLIERLENSLLSTGWKLVSFLPSKPVANSI